MITVKQAEQVIKDHGLVPKIECIPLAQCEGKILAEPVYADRDYPPIQRVMMDGIAISQKSYERGLREFPIMGMATAGMAPLNLENPQNCIEVMTGCVLPRGSDLVIPYEQLNIQQGVAKISVEANRQMNDFVHLQASDCRAGQLILSPGIHLKSIHLGVLASFGYQQLRVEKPTSIKVIATGDELIPIDQEPAAYQLRQSNTYALRAALVSYGFTDVVVDHVPDDPQQITSHYQANRQSHDVLIYAGGVSQGKRDYLPNIWSNLGVIPYIQGVQQKPGKPMWFGVDPHANTVVWGLPGNPISSLVCLHRYYLNRTIFYGRLTQTLTFQPNLTYFVPVKTNAYLELTPILPKNSGDFTALVESNGFIELPQAPAIFPVGEQFPFYPWY